MKITGTNSYIRVEIDGKIIKIEGEMVIGGFIAYKDSIQKWEVPANEKIDTEMKQQIIDSVVKESQKTNFRIEFE